MGRTTLPKFPPVAARDALKTFQLKNGFHLELVAAEPLVIDPIALAFDEDGRLFVVEMNDYPERGGQHLGRVKRLEDTDGDGRFDKSTVFAKDLRFPGAIFCYGGGVFVGATPELLYFRDTNDDGVADQKQVVLTRAISPTGKRAAKLLGATAAARRDEVVQRFLPALELRGDNRRGQVIFQQRCQSCHRLGTDGFAVGPDLAGARSGGKEKLLTNILDPNREVPPNYFAYVIETKEGDSYFGLIVNETANSITVRQALGIEVAVARSQIDKMQAQKISLMPEGLEEGLTQQDLADLVDFIFAEDR